MTSDLLDDEWPTYYRQLGSVEHLHALGVIAATFNVLEVELLHWFRASLAASYKKDIADHLFAALTNNTR
uniref:hypothetical protein n=1 Tax=Methylobacterium sp. B34 TaxID=95563 RepID=UPI0011AE85EA